MAELATLVIQILQLIWGWVYFLFPVKTTVVEKGSRGCRLTFGVRPKELNPGLRFGTSFQTLQQGRSRHICSNINSVQFNLTDGCPVKLDAMLIYNIKEYGKFLLNAPDSNFIICEFANAEIKKTVSQCIADDIGTQKGELVLLRKPPKA